MSWVSNKTHITPEIIPRGAQGFEVLPPRWVVERTFTWIFKNRSLVRDHEQLTAIAETLISSSFAAFATLLRRWA
ncbi:MULTISPECIES: transposase [Sphingobium]|uniref:transposase n=1 Tax=Sphingobium sp. MI1205 TaxID=407020 RepID=UPI0007705318|nr:transposase [Sphingobium sp. MI1205]AMK18310.1 transposase [Sphingobium sp. MI1205]